MEEKRRFVRFRAPFCISFADKDSSHELPGVVRDISMGGVRILLDTPLDILPDILVSLYILLPRNTLKLLGRVVWARSRDGRKEIGVCFVHTPDSYKEDIYNNIFKYYREEITRRWWQF